MPKKILQRCSICGKFHASYRVEDPETGRKLALCYSCWKTRYASLQAADRDETQSHLPDKDEKPH